MEANEAKQMLDAVVDEMSAEQLSESLKRTFLLLHSIDPETAVNFLEGLQGSLNYDNYLTEREATSIVSGFRNQDGTNGPKWRDKDAFFEKVKSIDGGQVENPPCYNKWALYTEMNKVASDHHSTLMKYADGDTAKYFEMVYHFAVNQLSDIDRPQYIREYFGVV